MKSSARKTREVQQAFALKPIACGVMLACCGGALANPTGPSVAAGAASFQANGKTLAVTNAPGTIINWQSFSIGGGEHTRFNQQSASSAVLNRVVGADGSRILGALTSNGRVFLVNPHGIVFGAGARIDTAGFIASTLNIADKDFLQGKFKFEGGGNGVLRNEGELRASGDIVLVGPIVENAGLIRSDDGAVLLAAGRSVTITSPDAQGVKFELQAPDDTAINLGTIEASGAASMLAGTLVHSGDLRAASANVEGGRVVLVAQKDATVEAGATISASGPQGGSVRVQSGDTTLVAGAIDASGSSAQGGKVELLGNRVGLIGAADVSASGVAGGGTILVGGDYQGKNADVQNAARTFVGSDVTLRADATAAGDGGKVIVWADDTTRFQGAISARGGAQGGDGGFVETSGKGGLSVAGARVDTRAPAGRTGTWLLDPKFVIVVAGGSSPLADADAFNKNASGTDTIDPGDINGAASDVVLQANTDVVFSSAIAMSNAGVGLTAQAGRSILVNADIVTNDGNITLVANETVANGVDPDHRDGVVPATITMMDGTLINAGMADVRLLVATGAGHIATSGDMTIANVSGDNVSVVHNGPEANKKILRASAASLISAANSVHLEHTTAGTDASIGTLANPIRIDTPRLEAHSGVLTGAVGGIFVESPNAGDLEIGGVPASIHAGPIRGVQARAGGPISITVNGNLTRAPGAAGCGPTGGAGGPICAVGVDGDITLNAAALGAPGPGRLHVDANGGNVSATSTVGGVFLERRAGDLVLSMYNVVSPAAAPLELATGNGVLNVDASIAAPGGLVTLVSNGPAGQIAFADGVTITADDLTLGGTGPAVFNAGTVTVDAPVTAGVPVSIGGAIVDFNGPLTANAALAVTSGQANLNAGGAIAGLLSLAGGTLASTGPVFANGGFELSGGTIAAGAAVLVTGTTLIESGTPQVAGSLVTDVLEMTGGTLAIPAGGLLQTDGLNASSISAAIVNNAGTFEIAGADLELNNGATFNNEATGLFDIQTDAGVRHIDGAAPVFSNAGILRKSVSFGTSIIGNPITLTNAPSGLIDVQSGTLQISNGMPDNDGTINVAVGATFSTNGAALTNSATGTIGGTGEVDLGGATLTNNGTLQPGMSGTGVLAITGNLTQGAGGQIDIDLTGTSAEEIDRVAITGVANLAGTLNVQHVDGFNPPSDSSYTILTYGARTGDFDTKDFPPGYGTFYNASPNAVDYVLSLGAVVNAWAAPGSGLWQTGANWTLGHAPTSGEDALINDLGGPGPSEIITVSQGGETARRLMSGENVTISGGTLTLGPLASQVNATLTVDEGTLTLTGPIGANVLALSGPMGFIDVQNGTLSQLNMSDGVLMRSTGGSLTMTGPFNISGGTIALGSGGSLMTEGVTTVTGVVNPFFNWTNSGTLNIEGAGQISPSPGSEFIFTNLPAGIVNLNGTDPNPFSMLIADAQIRNTGRFNKIGGAATQTIDTRFSNTDTGSVEVDSGTLVLPAMTILPGNIPNTQSGTLRVAPGHTLSTGGNNLTNAAGGVIGGRGTLDLGGATLTNDGTLQPGRILGGFSIGTLTIAGNLTQGAGGIVAVQLGGDLAGQYDVLNVTGSAALADSTLNVSTTGGYVPAAGDSFTVIEAPAVSGEFGAINKPPPGFPNALTPSYAAASVSLSIDAGPLNFWLPNADGNWDVAANWSLGVVPMPAHLAKIERPGAITVTVPNGFTAMPERLRSEDTLVVNGVLDLASASRANAMLSVPGGTLQGTGPLTVNGTLSLDAATIASAGGVTVNGTTGVSGGASQIAGSSLTTTGLNIASGSLTVSGGSTLALTGGLAKSIAAGAMLTNAGTVNLAVTSNNNGVAGAGTFQNNGTVNSTAAGITTLVSSVFNNDGTVNVDGGTLRLTGGGTDIGAYAIDAARTLDFGGGTRALDAGSSVTGAGTLLVSGGTTNVNAVFGATTTTISGGTANFNANVTGAGTLLVSGGIANVNAGYGATTTTISAGTANFNGGAAHSTATLDLTGGTLGGTGNLTVTTGGTWSGGSVSGGGASLTIANGAAFNLTGGAGKVVNSATLNNSGMLNLAGAGNLVLNNGAIANNSGTLDIQTDADIATTAGAGTLNNTGTVRKSAGAGTSTIASPVTLTSSGTFDVLAGTLDFASANNTFNNGTGFTGPGTHLVTGNSTFNGTITSNGLTLQSGIFGGNASFAGTTTWTGGTMVGVFTVPAGATLNLTGAGAKTVDAAAASLTNSAGGTVNLAGTGNLVLNNGATLNNAGTFDIQTDADVLNTAGGATLANTGTLRKSAGAGTSVIGSTAAFALSNAGGATIDVQSGTLQSAGSFATNNGTINVEGGTIFSTAGAALVNAGTLRGTGTVNVGASTLTNNSIIAPGTATDTTGTLAITGNLTQGAAGRVDIELGGTGAGAFDAVTVSGTATLDGTLALSTTGGYAPAVGDAFPILTAGTRTGNFATTTKTFANEVLPTYAAGGLTLTLGATDANTWIFDVSDIWTSAQRWSQGRAPIATDRVLIDRPVGAFTVTVPGGAFSAATLTSTENVTLNGTLDLAGVSSVTGTLAVNGGRLQGAGPVTVNGTLALDAGTIASAGGVTVNGTTGVSGGASQLTGSSLTTSGLAIASGSLTVVAGSTLGLTGTLAKSIAAGATLTNAGTVNLAVGADMTGVTGAGTFQNNAGGTVNSTAPGLTTLVSSIFNNNGIVNVDGGTLRLTGGGTDTGAYVVDAATTLEFGGGTRNLNAGSNVTGLGAVNVSGGTVNVNGNYGIATTGTTSVTGGDALRFNVDVTFANAFTLTGGESVALAGTGNIVMNGDFNWSGDTDTRGTGTLTTNGNVIVTGPAIPGIGHGIGKPWTNNGTVTFANGGLVKFTAGGSWTNSATGVVNLDNGAAEPVGYFNGVVPTFLNQGRIVKSAAGVQNFNGTVRFNNTGAGAGRGVHVMAGTLRLNGGGTDTGTYAIDAGTTLDFGGGARALNAGSSVTGAGTLLVSGGTTNVNAVFGATTTTISGGTANFNANVTGAGTVTVSGGTANVNAGYGATTTTISAGPANFNDGAHTTGTLNLTGGMLGGTGNLAVTTGGTWSGGALSGGAASLTIANGAVFNLTGDTVKLVDAATFTNSAGGSVNLVGTGSLALNNGARLNNAGLFDIQSDADIGHTAGGATFANTGMLRKSAGAGTSAIGANAAFTLSNAGGATIDVQSGTLQSAGSFPTNNGTINVEGGTIFSTAGAPLVNAGTLRGAGTVNVGASTLTNNSIIAPGTATDATGTLAITGNLTQGAAGRVDIELGGTAAGAFDAVTVSATAALDGTLALSTTGGYAPAVGDAFPILTAGTRTGNFATTTKTFANEVLPTYAAGGLTLTLGATDANTWIFDVSDTWTSAQRWSQGRAPIATDRVLIARPAGAFTVAVPAGAFSAASLTSTENVTLNGTLDLAGVSTVTGTLAVNGGRLQGAGPVTVNGTLALDAGTIASAGGVTVNGTTGVSGGASSLTGPLLTTSGLSMTSGSLAVAAGSTLGLTGGGAKTIGGGTLANSGRMNLAGTTNLALNAGGMLTNNAGATLDIQTNVNIERTVAAGAASTLTNAGTIMKSGAGGTSTIGGALPLASVSNGGTYDATVGTLMHAAMNTFNDGTRFIGAGMNVVTTDSTFNGTMTSNGVTLQSRTFGGNATFAGMTTWTGGTLAGVFGVPAGSTLNVTGGGAKTISGAGVSLTTNGTTNLTGPGDTVLANGALWDNFGALNLGGVARIVLAGDGAATLVNRGTGVITDTSTNATPITAGAQPAGKAFSNAGTFNKNAGSAATQTLDVPMTNTGTINVRTGTLVANGFPTNNGVIDLEAGTTLSTAGAAFTNGPIGSIIGNGTILSPTFTNNGSVGPGDSPGTLTIAGNFVQGPSGTLVVELGGSAAGVDYDVLTVTGNATLDGALAIFTTPGQMIERGSDFDFMTYASRTGDFATFAIPPGQTFQLEPGPTSYRVSSIPPADVLANVNRVGQRDAIVLAERRPDNTLVADPQRQSDEEDRALGECR